ncbi:MAG: hypothetical protein IJU32_04335 [Pyramidobacter sp.]|nr:hypothetical protein [Pyramidobacter sp.]
MRLARLKIPISTVEYEVAEEDLSVVHAAESSAIPLERIDKTLVLRDCGHVMKDYSSTNTLNCQAYCESHKTCSFPLDYDNC